MGRQHKQALPGRESRGVGQNFVKGLKLVPEAVTGALGAVGKAVTGGRRQRTARAAATGIAAGAAGRVRSSGNRAVTNPNRDTAAAMRRGAAQAAGRRRR